MINPNVSVIIVNYNTRKITCDCLDSIFKHTVGIYFEVIVIDNNSVKDDSILVLSQYPNIKFIKSNENIGFGKANNLALKYAKGKYIFLLNSDTIFLNNAIKIFFDSMQKLPANISCIGTRLMAADFTQNHSFEEFPSILSTIRNSLDLYLEPLGIKFKKFNERLFDGLECFEVPYIIGADMFIRKSVIDQLGLFDPDFFMYYEESEMQFRYSKAGYKQMIISGPEIVHFECASTKVQGKKYSYEQRRMFFTSLFIYMRKRYSLFKYIVFRICLIPRFPIFFAKYYTGSESFKMLFLLFDFRK